MLGRLFTTARAAPAPRPSRLSRRTRTTLLATAAAATAWALALAHFFNRQRHASAPIAAILFTLRHDPRAIQLLGDAVDMRHGAWTWIGGTVDQLHGVVDVAFLVRGAQGDGRVCFESRRGRDGAWQVRRFELQRVADRATLDLAV